MIKTQPLSPMVGDCLASPSEAVSCHLAPPVEWTLCHHCQQPTPPQSLHSIQDNQQTFHFCCMGCASAWQIIQASGLGAYYDRREFDETAVANKPDDFQDFSRFDRPSIYQTYVRNHESGLAEIHLMVEGIHCAACVWLIEKYIVQQSGVKEVSLNFGTRRARVLWNPEEIQLSGLLHKFQEIGYAALPYDASLVEAQRRRSLRNMLMRLAVAGFCAGNVMMMSISLYAGYFSGMAAEYKLLFESINGLLTLPAMLYSALPFWQGARNALKVRQPNMDLLIALGVGITFCYSVIMLFTRQGEPYFDSCVMLIFFLLIGRTLEHLTQSQVANITERLSGLTPRFAVKLEPDGQETLVSLNEVEIGNQLRVRPGDTIPVDGQVSSGIGEVDEASLTGESHWRSVQTGDTVWAGSLNQTGSFVLEAQAIGADSVLSRIVAMVENATQRKTKLQRMADQVAAWFVWVVLALTLGTWLWWMWGTVPPDGKTAWMIAVSVVIIACPCALGLATPTAILAATGRAVKQGWLIKGGEVLEQAHHITDIVFDKTGTLTYGQMQVVAVESYEAIEDEVPSLFPDWLIAAFHLERCANHPIADALRHYVESQQWPLGVGEVTSVTIHPGKGISGVWQGKEIAVGNIRLLEALGIADQLDSASFYLPMPTGLQNHLQEFANEDLFTLDVHVSINGHLRGSLHLQDQVKPDVAEVIDRLHQYGLQTHILSGDHPQRVSALADRVGIQEAHGHLLPDQKLTYLQRLQNQGHRVMMVGDGLNDAPALTQADLGVAVENATDLSLETSDIVLIRATLTPLPDLFQLSSRTVRVIRQNLALSLSYNAVTLPLAIMGWVNPLFAAIVMALSSVVVTLNALRLR